MHEQNNRRVNPNDKNHNTLHRPTRPYSARPDQAAQKKPARRQLDAHEHMLLASKRSGSIMTISLMNGESVSGIVTDFDRYSFTIKDGSGVEVCMFKHAVATFRPVASRV
ncbi:RNA chaperone Hfq [Aeromonas veronii]|uniref:RNA chaperone Hfq n=1 Tax=Aeromonas TaxID=642 RepID=UPI002E7ADBE8|nr:RNA chaperone Hfq [Aeromonas caviae]MEE1913684.1 RNA chaperone Hfq [Aeromonas caviae]